MGPIEYTLAQIAFNVEKKYGDKVFSSQILDVAGLIHLEGIEESDYFQDWQDNENLLKIQKIGKMIGYPFQFGVPKRFWTKFGSPRGGQNPLKSIQNPKKACSGGVV